MSFEVGKKYKRDNTVVEVKFIDYTGDAWGLTDKLLAKRIISTDRAWQEITDTPDPGEGWRLLEPDEDVEIGDEYFRDGTWKLSGNKATKQSSIFYYRRRIKPDPGEGWRLLHPDEDVEEGDQYFSDCNGRWIESNNYRTNNCKQNREMFYRRSIAPQYVPYTWEDREELRGRWYRIKSDKREIALTAFQKHGDKGVLLNSWRSDEFLESCEWLDGTPCGKKSE
jgi:hypothetical protein